MMELSDLDMVDRAIGDAYYEIKRSSIIHEIERIEEENFEKLLDLAWDIKVDELGEEVHNA